MTTQSQKPKVLIQKIDDETLKVCNEITKTGKQLKESCFSASNTRKVHPKALIERLEEFSKLCASEKLKSEIQGIMINVRDMCFEGDTKMFISHNSKEDGSKLEFICAVVYVYKCEGGQACGKCNACKSCKESQRCESCNYCKACQEPFDCKQCNPCKAGKKCKEAIPCGECKACRKCKASVSCGRCEECRRCEGPVACNYLLSTYSYQEKVNRAGLGVGIATAVGGVLAGGVALAACFATGGIGFLVAGGIAAVAGAGAGAGGGIIIYKSADTTISVQLKNLLEASFVYELSARAFAEIENGSLYLCLEN